jgi:N-acetylmuramoyl-L-alanine amidase
MENRRQTASPRTRHRGTTLVIIGCGAVVIAVVAAAMSARTSPRRSQAESLTRASLTVAPHTTSAKPALSTSLMPSTTLLPSTTLMSSTTRPASTTSSSSGLVSLRAVAGKIIVVDAGHDGGNASHAAEISRPIFIGTGTRACDTVGTETNNGYPEHAFTFDVALRLEALLQQAGAHVVMTRTNDTGVGPCIDQRAYIGNRAHAAVGISIHADGGPATGRGFCVYMPALTPHYTDDIYAASHRLGVDIRDEYGVTTGIPPATYTCSDGLAEANNYGGLNLSNVPKVLFETSNMRNATDAALIEQASVRQRIALGIALGLARYLAGS